MRIAFLLIWLTATIPAWATPAHIIVIRHAEKPKDHDDPHLSEIGRDRACRLVDYFRRNPEITKVGAPVALLATRPTKGGGGQRPGETLEPLSEELKLPIEKPYQSDHAKQLARAVLSNSDYDQKTVLICWTHEYIPELLEALGVHPAPAKLRDDVYDVVYVVHPDDDHPTMDVLRQDMPSGPHQKQKFHLLPKKALKG